eukprot:scaffold22589_cov138-Cylindrotheca_fusiformis.AAC.21
MSCSKTNRHCKSQISFHIIATLFDKKATFLSLTKGTGLYSNFWGDFRYGQSDSQPCLTGTAGVHVSLYDPLIGQDFNGVSRTDWSRHIEFDCYRVIPVSWISDNRVLTPVFTSSFAMRQAKQWS